MGIALQSGGLGTRVVFSREQTVGQFVDGYQQLFGRLGKLMLLRIVP